MTSTPTPAAGPAGPRASLAVFARPVEPGRVKTRLARALGDGPAASLYAAFLEDALATARRVDGADVTVWVAGDPDHPSLARAAAGLRRARQPDGADLGARMQQALDQGLRRLSASLVVGTDAPTLPPRLLGTALARLEAGAPWVVGPATDGGFWLLGVREPLGPGALDGVRWSASTTLEETRARLGRRLGPPSLLPPWYDVDGVEDLRLLRAHLAVDPRAAPATGRWLAANSPAGPRTPPSSR